MQNSAYPDAYAKHEPLATAVVDALADGAGQAAGSVADPRCAQNGEIAASGWTAGAFVKTSCACPSGSPAATGLVTVRSG